MVPRGQRQVGYLHATDFAVLWHGFFNVQLHHAVWQLCDSVTRSTVLH